jgi:heme-degrading monooxygenase HmoA
VTEVFARIHTLRTTPDQHEAGLTLVRDDLLPWTRDSTGFRGLIGLRHQERDETLVITLWDSEASLEASAVAAEQLSALAASVTGAGRDAVESYEVSLFEVR